MNIDPSLIHELFQSVCDLARLNVRQTNAAVVSKARRRLAIDPADGVAKSVLAASFLVSDQPPRSLEVLGDDEVCFGEDPLFNRIAGYAHLMLGEVETAAMCFDRVIRLDPHQPDCWWLLGRIAMRRSDQAKAIEYFEQGALLDGDARQSTLALARLQARRGQLKEAIHALRVCLLRDQRHPAVNWMLAKLLQRRAMRLGRTRQFAIQQRVRQEALECCRVVNAASESVGSWILQGRLEQQLFDHAAARRSFRQAVRLHPQSASAQTFLASSEVDFGDLDAGIESFQRALVLDPTRAETHFRYTRAKRFASDRHTRRYIKQLQEHMCQGTQSVQRMVHWHFAIAKVYDDTGRFDLAWKHYSLGNQLKIAQRESHEYSKPTTRNGALLADVARRCESVFTREFYEQNAHIGHSSEKPIFIVGIPRSGTTLTEQILCSHPQVAGAGELQYINQIRHEAEKIRKDGLFSASTDTGPIRLSSFDMVPLRQMAEGYLTYLDRFRTDERFVTDKMPTNFMHLGLIALLFPNARVIHCRRDPMDVIVSCFSQHLNPPFCDPEAMVDYHRSYRRLMRYWEQVLPTDIHTVDYETLTEHPESQTRALIEHCGLEWTPECLQFHATARAVHTPSKWQVRQPMYRSSVGKWRRFEPHLRSVADRIEAEIRSESAAVDHCMSIS